MIFDLGEEKQKKKCCPPTEISITSFRYQFFINEKIPQVTQILIITSKDKSFN